MESGNSALNWAGSGMPSITITYVPPVTAEPDPAVAARVLAAAERGDRFAFTAAAERLGSLEQAQALVRARGIVRSVDRVANVAAWQAAALAAPEIAVRAADSEAETDTDTDPTMFGHFAVFDQWTEINSWFEGHFLERIAKGAFKKTFREHRGEIKPLFQHGHDPQVGDKPLGTVGDLREDDTGAYYEVPLLDAPYVRDDILPGLRAGLYGASFRFQTIREEFSEKPDPSDHNPTGLPERTLKELRLFEFGPVTFPAYPAATAAVREATTPPADDAEADSAHPDQDAPVRVPAGAGRGSHLIQRGRRGTPYTLSRKETPSWRL